MFTLRGGCCAEKLRQREIETYNDYVVPSEGCVAEFVVVVAFFFLYLQSSILPKARTRR